MAFDWFTFLRQNNIPHTTTGPNASRGRVNIKCPLCADDPSEHMGISTSGHGWSCWRNPQHKGKADARLVSVLLGCGRQEAERIVGGAALVPGDTELGEGLKARLGERLDDNVAAVKELWLPKEFKPMDNGSPFARQFHEYLRERDYRPTHIKWLIETYRLHYCISGRFAYRIIIPIFDRWGDLLTWTARSIRQDEEVRYKTLKREQQVCSPKETLLGLPLLWSCSNPKVLLVCEGPFDAFRITALGHSLGVYGTCLFGLSMSGPQSALLLGLQERFKDARVLLDSAASFQAFRMANSGLSLGIDRLPEDVKDPGELPAGEVVDLCMRILNRTSAA
jgi:hypothetical protein